MTAFGCVVGEQSAPHTKFNKMRGGSLYVVTGIWATEIVAEVLF